VIAAIAQADWTRTLNRAGVLVAMQKLPDLAGVNVTYDFDRNGDNTSSRSVSSSSVQNGVFNFVQALNAP
jgi:hypothetical protein